MKNVNIKENACGSFEKANPKFIITSLLAERMNLSRKGSPCQDVILKSLQNFTHVMLASSQSQRSHPETEVRFHSKDLQT